MLVPVEYSFSETLGTRNVSDLGVSRNICLNLSDWVSLIWKSEIGNFLSVDMMLKCFGFHILQLEMVLCLSFQTSVQFK